MVKCRIKGLRLWKKKCFEFFSEVNTCLKVITIHIQQTFLCLCNLNLKLNVMFMYLHKFPRMHSFYTEKCLRNWQHDSHDCPKSWTRRRLFCQTDAWWRPGGAPPAPPFRFNAVCTFHVAVLQT